MVVRVPGNPEPDGAEELWFEGRGGLKLRALLAPALGGSARGTVIVFAGRTEFIEKYFEVVGELQGRGFTVFIMDWRGQGLSERELPNSLKGHLVSFDDPVADLDIALRRFGAQLPRPHLVLAHSMGGAIALRALQTNRMVAEGALFSSPMWGVSSLRGLAEDFTRFCNAIGLGGLFAPGVERTWRKQSFQRNALTGDRRRYARGQDLVAQEPRLALAGPTIGWAFAAIETLAALKQPGVLAHLRLPIVVLSAGKETIVDNRAHAVIAGALPNCRLLPFPNARHEILMETDDIRARFWEEFDELAASVAPVRAKLDAQPPGD
jgi:lysophospholipase